LIVVVVVVVVPHDKECGVYFAMSQSFFSTSNSNSRIIVIVIIENANQTYNTSMQKWKKQISAGGFHILVVS
jgi:MFS superfamily sulfate permease-like transporter